MELTDSEVAALVDAMANAYTVPELRLLLQPLGKQLDQLANTQAVTATLGVIVDQVVQDALRSGWTAALVGAVWASRETNPRVRAFYTAYRQRVPVPPPTPANPYATHEVVNGRLFVNRSDLRNHLQSFLGATSSRVFAVDGEDGSGRAYTYKLIEYLGRHTAWYPVVVYIDLIDFGPREPVDLLRLIFAEIGTQLPAIEARDSRNEFPLTVTLETELNHRDLTLCLVFGRFADANLNADTRKFIEHLAVQTVKRVRRLRLVLLGYDRPLVEIHDDVLWDRISPLTPDDFANCVANVLRAAGVPGATGAHFLPDVEAFFAQYPAADAAGKPDPDRMTKIERAVRQYIARARVLKAGGGP